MDAFYPRISSHLPRANVVSYIEKKINKVISRIKRMILRLRKGKKKKKM